MSSSAGTSCRHVPCSGGLGVLGWSRTQGSSCTEGGTPILAPSLGASARGRAMPLTSSGRRSSRLRV
eukprot:2105908-Prymnesium_polylepis.1